MKKFRFIDGGLAGDVFLPDRQASAAGIFLFGFPAFIGPNEVTRAFVDNGLISFQPHYFGTYDSDGQFSPTSIVDTCRRSQEFFDRGSVAQTKNNEPFKLNQQIEICVGHSFGGLVALRAAHSLHNLKVLVLMGPTLHYSRSNPDFGNNADGMKSLGYVRLANPRTYRLAPDSDWQTLMSGREPLPPATQHPTLREVIAVVGEHDSYVDIPAFQQSFHLLVAAYCGPSVQHSIVVVPNGGHTLDYLVDAPGVFRLEEVIKRHGLAKP